MLEDGLGLPFVLVYNLFFGNILIKKVRNRSGLGLINCIETGRDEARINGLGSSRLFAFRKDDGYASDRSRCCDCLEGYEDGKCKGISL